MRRFVVPACLLLITTVAGRAQSPEWTDARVIVQAMLRHDVSIRSLEWDGGVSERTRVPDDNGATLSPRWDDWALYREGRYGEDSDGRWYFNGRIGTREDSKSPMAWSDARFVSTTEYTVATSPGTGTYIIDEPLENPRYYPGPLSALGRWIDITGTKRLGEILLEAQDLAIQKVNAAEGLVLLQAEVEIDGVATVLLVTVDTEHDFAPRAIRRFNATLNHIEEELVTERFEQIDGAWVPVAGTRILYARAPLSDEERTRLKTARERLGRSLGLESTDPVVMRKAHAEVFGASGFPVRALGNAMHRFDVSSVRRLNNGLELGEMTVIIAPGDTVFNRLNGRDTNHAPVTDVVSPCTLIRVRGAKPNGEGAGSGVRDPLDGVGGER